MKNSHELIQRIFILEETVREFNQWLSANKADCQEYALCQLSSENGKFIADNFCEEDRLHLLSILVDQSLEALQRIKEDVQAK